MPPRFYNLRGNYETVKKLKRAISLISIGLLIFGASLVVAQQITVSRGQTFTVYASVYKPAGISFPSGGARLYAGICNPNNYLETYNVGGWTANTLYIQWDNEERSDNFSLQVTVTDDAPAGKIASLRVLLSLDNNSIYATSNIALALETVEVGSERFSKYMPGTLVGPPYSSTGNYYFITATDVVIAAAESPLPLWALAVIIVLVVLLIIVLVVGWKKHGIETLPSSAGPEWE